MRAIVAAGAVLLWSADLSAQRTSLVHRTPASEPNTALWESITTVGPALIHWKVINQSWEGQRHCVEIVVDAPDVVESSYEIERVFGEERVRMQGPRGDLSMSFQTRWWHDVDTTLSDTDLGRPGLTAEHHKNCLLRDSRVLPSEVRIFVTGIELRDGRAFGDPRILESREQSRRRLRTSLLHLNGLSRDGASLPGIEGFQRLRAHLAANPENDPLIPAPFMRWHVRDWMDGVAQGHPDLRTTPEQFIPRLRALIGRYLQEIDTN